MGSQLSLFSSLPISRSPKSSSELWSAKSAALRSSSARRYRSSSIVPVSSVRVCPGRGVTLVTRGNVVSHYPLR